MRLRNNSAVAAVALLTATLLMSTLAGCDDGKHDATTPSPVAKPAASRGIRDDIVKIGKPYQIAGRIYAPTDEPQYDKVGYASWYGEEFSGSPTANGEPFRPTAIAAAHRTLPLPSYVEVTALDSGRTILVRVNDRGPFSPDRVIDLSRGAAEQLGIAGHGAVAVRVRRVNPSGQERALLRDGGKAAERLETPMPLLAALRHRLPEKSALWQAPPVAQSSDGPEHAANRPAGWAAGYAVQVAAFASARRANALASRIGATALQAGPLWRVRFGPYASRAETRRGIDLARAKGFNDVQIVANDHP
ncbi:septal ring lytic transglycosylase RlpA family protein [Sphingobium aquiterrae]|uniref:septal ring lytic transglycosylase RlpA family protein n=1 Tax=Sphingobium aquiterrae TaxID=2038656 RepID=UPI003019DF12